MSKFFWHPPAIVDSVFTYFLKLGEDVVKKNCRKVFIIMEPTEAEYKLLLGKISVYLTLFII